MLLDERHDPGEPRPGPVAVLVVDRVDDRPAAEQLEPGLDDGRLGGVEHQRQRRRGGEPADDRTHVRDAVAADVVDADVEQVGAVAGLVAGDLDAVVPALLEHRLAERLGAVGVGALADREVATCPGGTARAGRATRRPPRARGRRVASPRPCDPLDDLAQVLGRRAAAAADQGEAEVLGEVVVRVGELLGRERVGRAVLAEHRQPGVGHAGQADPGVPGQVAQVLAHLGRAGGAVQPDEVDAERLQRGQRRTDLGAEQHRAGRLDRDLARSAAASDAGGLSAPAWRR